MRTLMEVGWQRVQLCLGRGAGAETTEEGTSLVKEETEDLGGDISSRREARGIAG